MSSPPNISGNAAGYNKGMFKSNRAIRRAFKLLGYPIDMCEHNVDRGNVRHFQKDFNRCSKKAGKWGQIEATGKLDKDTLNALEIALRWAKKRENTDGTPCMVSWQSFCAVARGKGRTFAEVEAEAPIEKGTNYVEVSPNGMAKLRNVYNDHCLRAELLDFERHGAVAFATVILPPQGDLPGGRSEPMTCPCVFGCC